MIEYKIDKGNTLKIFVLLDKKRVGYIKKQEEGWQYFPNKQKKGGEIFEKLQDLKDSLEED